MIAGLAIFFVAMHSIAIWKSEVPCALIHPSPELCLLPPSFFARCAAFFREQLWDMRSGSCAHQLQGLHTDQVGQKRVPSYPVACAYTLPVEVLETQKCMRNHVRSFFFLLCTSGRMHQSPIVPFNGSCGCEGVVDRVIDGPEELFGKDFPQKNAPCRGYRRRWRR